jgi:hypothetical protein
MGVAHLIGSMDLSTPTVSADQAKRLLFQMPGGYPTGRTSPYLSPL